MTAWPVLPHSRTSNCAGKPKWAYTVKKAKHAKCQGGVGLLLLLLDCLALLLLSEGFRLRLAESESKDFMDNWGGAWWHLRDFDISRRELHTRAGILTIVEPKQPALHSSDADEVKFWCLFLNQRCLHVNCWSHSVLSCFSRLSCSFSCSVRSCPSTFKKLQ